MAGRVTVLTPVDNTPIIELGNSTWRKQILPVGWLDYDDGETKRRLNFTPDYLRNLVTAFKAKAFDAVPLQLGGAHNNDPENTAGHIVGLDSDDKGLYATVSATDRGTRLLRDNQNLGVSVRLVEDYERQDGQSKTPFKAALQHVLATWVPKVAGMPAWQAVQCSDESEGRFVDLSALVFNADGEAKPVAPIVADQGGQQEKPPQEARATVPTQVTEEELAAVRSVLSVLPVLQKLVGPDEGETSTEDVTETQTAVTPVAPVKPVEDATEADEDVEAEQAIAAAVGAGEGNAVELAQVEMRTQMDRMVIQLAEVQSREDAANWALEREQLTRQYGIPPAIVALAEPLLRGAKHVVELSDGSSVDAGAVMRSVLTTVAKTYGKRVDVSDIELGSAHEAGTAADEAKAARARIHDAARAAGFGK